MRRKQLGVLLLVSVAAQGVLADQSQYVQLPGKQLAQGRVLWLDNCEGCHGYGTAGAPIPMQPDEWEARLQQPMATLYQHAIDGFFGPDDTMMPARGGNDALTDDEVRSAVDYMAALARHFLNKQEKP